MGPLRRDTDLGISAASVEVSRMGDTGQVRTRQRIRQSRRAIARGAAESEFWASAELERRRDTRRETDPELERSARPAVHNHSVRGPGNQRVSGSRIPVEALIVTAVEVRPESPASAPTSHRTRPDSRNRPAAASWPLSAGTRSDRRRYAGRRLGLRAWPPSPSRRRGYG
jgi:hypothetical protein